MFPCAPEFVIFLTLFGTSHSALDILKNLEGRLWFLKTFKVGYLKFMREMDT